VSFVSDFLRDLKFGPIEAARRRADEIADYGYPEPDTSTYHAPPPPEPDFGQWDALAANEGVDPYSQDYSSDEALTGWDNANGGWMGAEIPASEPTVEPYYPEDTPSWASSIPSASSFSERLAEWRNLNRPESDPYADVIFADPLQEPQDNGGYVTPARIPLYEQLAEPDFGQWDSLPTPGAETSFEYQPERNPELERWAMAQDDASYPGTYELNLGWSPPVSLGEDFTGNQKYYDINSDGTLVEPRNPVMGEDGDSWDWTKNAIGEGLHVANVAQTAPKEIASDFFPTIVDSLSGQALSDAAGGGWKGGVLKALARYNPATGPIAGTVGSLSDLADFAGIYEPGTGYDDAQRPFTTALESDDPWDYAERLTEQNSQRPFMQQLAGELINPPNALGAGLIGDDAPRLVKGIDTAADWLQGGPIFNTAIDGLGRGAGAVTGALRRAPGAIDAFDNSIFGRLAREGQSLEFGGGDFGAGSAFDPSSLNIDEMTWLDDAPRFPISNSVTPEVVAPTPLETARRSPLDIAATIKQPDELMAQGADDIRMTLEPRFDLPPADDASAAIFENISRYNAARDAINVEDATLRRTQFGSAENTYQRVLAETGSPTEALRQAAIEGSNSKRFTPYETMPLTTEQMDGFILRAQAMKDQGGLTTPQFVYELPRALAKINAGEAPAPAELELLRYIATGVKESNAGFKVPDIADTDTLPMFGADTDFSAKIGKMDNPDLARPIISTGEPQPNLFRLGSEEAGSPYRVEGDINPTEQSFVPPRIDTNTQQMPLTLEYGADSFLPAVAPNNTGFDAGDLPRIPTNTQQLPAVLPYGADGFIPAVTPNTTGIEAGDLPNIPTNTQQLPAVLPYGTDSFVPAVTPNKAGVTSADMPRIPTDQAQLDLIRPYGTESYMTMVGQTPTPFEFTSVPDDISPTALSRRTAEAANKWRELNYPAFEEISSTAGTGRVSRIVNGGDLPSKLANTITLRARELTQSLEHSGVSRDDAMRIARAEISAYMDKRFADALFAGDTEGAARQAFTALNLGDFHDPAFSKTVESYGLKALDKDAGKVPGWMRTAETISAKVKNQKFGFLDINAIGANVLPAIEGGFPAMASKMLNEIVGSVTGKRLLDFDEMYKTGQLADPSMVGLNIRPKGLDVNPEAGTIVGGVGSVANSLGAKKVGSALNTVDRGLTKYNDFLTDVQYNKILGGQRKAIYEGNLLIMKMTGKDVTDPAVQRTAAEMANALTSAANLATRNGRRAVENTSLTSASFLRAQGELLKQLSNIVTGGTTTKNAGIVGGVYPALARVCGLHRELNC